MRKKLMVALFGLRFGVPFPALAQDQGPPNILHIIQESVKPGRVPAHEKVEAGWPRAFARAKWSAHYLGMVSLTGPDQAWFLVGYDSLAAWEKNDRDFEKAEALKAETERLGQQDGELLSGSRSLIAVHRDDLSLSPHFGLPRMRYFSVEIARLRPGYEEDYGEVRKLFNAAHPKVHMEHHHIIYQVVSGAPGPLFLMFSPLQSREEDAPLTQAFFEALGEVGRHRDRELSRSGVINYETLLFAINPKISYPPREWISADPDFWASQPKPAQKSPARQ